MGTRIVGWQKNYLKKYGYFQSKKEVENPDVLLWIYQTHKLSVNFSNIKYKMLSDILLGPEADVSVKALCITWLNVFYYNFTPNWL